jgi:uroporphyrinogen-III synthase
MAERCPGGSPGPSPLAGRTVVNTRAPHQAEELSALLRARDAHVLLYPCIDIAPPEDLGVLDAALGEAAGGRFGWLLLTSVNTVQVLSGRLEALGLRLPAELRVAAIGPATAKAARQALGVEPLGLPGEFSAEGLADALERAPGGAGLRGSRVLLTQADLARPVLARRLLEAGADLTAVTAYRTVPGSGGPELSRLLVRPGGGGSAGPAGKVDAVVLASASAAQNLVTRLTEEGGSPELLEGVCVACIGRVTAQAARELGLSVDVCPAEHTLPALVRALEAYYGAGDREGGEEL